MKWMYLSSLFKDNSDFLFFFFCYIFIPGESLCCRWNVRVFCHKDIIALESGHLLPFLSRVSESCGFPIWFLLKSVLIFHHWDFYGTDSIPEKHGGRNLIFRVQLFICAEVWTVYR